MMSYLKFTDSSSEVSFEKIKDADTTMKVIIKVTDSSNLVHSRSLIFEEKEIKELHSHLTLQLSKLKKIKNATK
jgi:hypothetical protein